MPNFAGNLHLLVDSIHVKKLCEEMQIILEIFGYIKIYVYLCSVKGGTK